MADQIVPILDMPFLEVLSFSSIISTIGLFLCGIPICRTIADKGNTDGINQAPFLLGTIGCFFWLRYGLLKDDSTILTVNGIGIFLQIFYLSFYYYYTRNKRTITRQILVIAVLTGAMLWYVYMYAAMPDIAINHLGMMCVVLNVLNLASPLAGLVCFLNVLYTAAIYTGEVLRTRSTESLPLPLCAANLIVSAQWFMYGTLVEDLYIKGPNFIGIILALIQLSLFLIYPRSRVHRG